MRFSFNSTSNRAKLPTTHPRSRLTITRLMATGRESVPILHKDPLEACMAKFCNLSFQMDSMELARLLVPWSIVEHPAAVAAAAAVAVHLGINPCPVASQVL